jgi:hypothetical protein
VEHLQMESPRQDNSSSILIIALVVVGGILLVCICLVVILAVLTLLGPAIGNVFYEINGSIQPVP